MDDEILKQGNFVGIDEYMSNTDRIINWEESINEIKKFIRQTDGLILSKEQYDKMMELIKDSPSGNIEIPTIDLG